MQIVPFKYDEEMGRKLWSISEELTGISAVYVQRSALRLESLSAFFNPDLW